jgi:hypothetical protein
LTNSIGISLPRIVVFRVRPKCIWRHPRGRDNSWEFGLMTSGLILLFESIWERTIQLLLIR